MWEQKIPAPTNTFCDLCTRMQSVLGVEPFAIRVSAVKCDHVEISALSCTRLELVLAPVCRRFLHIFGRHQYKLSRLPASFRPRLRFAISSRAFRQRQQLLAYAVPIHPLMRKRKYACEVCRPVLPIPFQIQTATPVLGRNNHYGIAAMWPYPMLEAVAIN